MSTFSYLFLGVLFTAVLAVSATYGVMKSREHGKQIDRLEKAISELSQNARHDRLGLVQHDIGEADLFAFSRLRENLLEDIKLADYFAKRAAHVAAGGKPDDKPSEWKTLRNDQ